jgi:dolichol-phosphate mannosyltransferase
VEGTVEINHRAGIKPYADRRALAGRSAVRGADTLVFAPTYNEGESIGLMLEQLLALPAQYDVLIIDDGSNDGTQSTIAEHAARDPHVRLLDRGMKLGIGSAHRLAWLHARRLGYTRIVTLDADLSHDPADIPRLLAAIDRGADIAIGSRFVSGGRLDYSGWRLFVSRLANRVARRVLRLPVREYTTSLRAARLDRVAPGLVESIAADGYSFFVTCMVYFARSGLKIAEVPIHFHDRHGGESKLPRFEILRGAVNLMQLAIERGPPSALALLGEAECDCSHCLKPYRVRTDDGGVRCLACSNADGAT